LSNFTKLTRLRYEFGGPVGVTAMMLGFPLLMCECKPVGQTLRLVDYLWICLWFYQGKMVHPKSVDDIKPFLQTMWRHCYEVCRACP
jgi:delta24(24(1))-sterol reductase